MTRPALIEDPENDRAAGAIPTLKVLIAALANPAAEIGQLDTGIARRTELRDVARRLMTVPGIGPLIATAMVVLTPLPLTFRKARDLRRRGEGAPLW